MSKPFEVKGKEREIVKEALTLFVETMAKIRVVECDDPRAMSEKYSAAKVLLSMMSLDESGKYHSLLLLRDNNGKPRWEIDFGSYDYGEVVLEGSQHESDDSDPFLIITTEDVQDAIEAEVERQNGILKNG